MNKKTFATIFSLSVFSAINAAQQQSVQPVNTTITTANMNSEVVQSSNVPEKKSTLEDVLKATGAGLGEFTKALVGSNSDASNSRVSTPNNVSDNGNKKGAPAAWRIFGISVCGTSFVLICLAAVAGTALGVTMLVKYLQIPKDLRKDLPAKSFLKNFFTRLNPDWQSVVAEQHVAQRAAALELLKNTQESNQTQLAA